MSEKKQTGFPSIDKPWMKYYKVSAKTDVIDLSIYQVLSKTYRKYKNINCLNYFGRTITYGEFMNTVDKYAAAFLEMDVKEQEVVCVLGTNIPEFFYSIYALNKIGAIVSTLDPRYNGDKIKDCLNEANATKLIMLENCFPIVDKIISKTNVMQVYTISATDSLPFVFKCLKKTINFLSSCLKRTSKCPKNHTYFPLKKYISHCKRDPKFDEYKKYEARISGNDIAFHIHTSGTTGTPKGVMLTNKNLNAIAYSYLYSGKKYEIGDRFLGMPIFIAYGIGGGLHMALLLGFEYITVPKLKVNGLGKLIRKYHINHFAGVPIHYQYFINDPNMKNFDLSFVKTAAYGGCSMEPKFKQKCNEFLEKHNCPNHLTAGYGCTESAGVIATQYYIGESDVKNELTTVGIPTLFTNIKIRSIDGKRYLKYNETGEILVSGSSVMEGYLSDKKATNNVIENIDGEKWLHTGDLGYVDKDGRLYMVDRIKNMIVRPDGHNVWPYQIEIVINTHPAVKRSVCIGVKNNQNINGEIPVVFVVLNNESKDKAEKVIKELKILSAEKLPSKDIALDYVIVNSIPLTSNAKTDCEKLRKIYEKIKHRSNTTSKNQL